MKYLKNFYSSISVGFKSRQYMPELFAVLVFFVVLTVISTWPLAIQLGSHVKDPGDYFFITWVINSTYDLAGGVGWDTFWDKAIFYPYPNSGAFSDHSLTLSLISLPVMILELNEIYLANYLALSGYILTGITGYYLFKFYTSSKIAALVGGIVLTYSTYHLSQMGHLQVLHMEFIPLTILYFEKLIQTPKYRNILWFSTFFILNAFVSVYHLSFVLIPLIVISVIRLIIPIIKERSLKKQKGRFLFTVAGLFVSFIVLAPSLLPYLAVNKDFNVEVNSRDAIYFSARPESYILPSGSNNLLLGDFRDFYVSTGLNWGWWETVLYPGIFTLLLALLSIFVLKEIQSRKYIVIDLNHTQLIYLLLLVIAVILTFGPFLVPPNEIYEGFKLPYYYLSKIPLYKAIRVPARFGSIIALSLALLVSFTILKVEVKNRVTKFAAIVVIMLLLFVDTASIPNDYSAVTPTNLELKEWIATTDESSKLAFIPVMQSHYKEVEYMRYQYGNPRRTLNGYSGYIPELSWDLGSVTYPQNFGTKEAEEVVSTTLAIGIDFLLIDKREYSAEQIQVLLSIAESEVSGSESFEIGDFVVLQMCCNADTPQGVNNLPYVTEIKGNGVEITQINKTDELIVFSELSRFDISIEYQIFGLKVREKVTSYKPILLIPDKSYTQIYSLNPILMKLGAEVSLVEK